MENKKYYSDAERKSFGRGFFTGLKKSKQPKKRLVYKKKNPVKKKFDVSIGADGRYYSDESGRMEVVSKEQALASGMPISRVVSYSELTPKQKKEHDNLKNQVSAAVKGTLDKAGIEYKSYGGESNTGLMTLAVSHANFLRDKYKLSAHDHASNLQLIKEDLEENPTFRESLRRKYIEGRKDWKYNSSTGKFGE